MLFKQIWDCVTHHPIVTTFYEVSEDESGCVKMVPKEKSVHRESLMQRFGAELLLIGIVIISFMIACLIWL